MNPSSPQQLAGRLFLGAIGRAWRPLLLAELLLSLLATTLLGPMVLAFAYRLIGFGNADAWSNWEVARLLVSLRGLLALALGGALGLGLLFLEFAVLILLVDAAIDGRSVALRNVVARIVGAAPSLFKLSGLCAVLGILLFMPFAAVGALAYQFLLGGTDINFYVAERPPRFWAAVIIGVLLAASFGLIVLWLFLRWAFALPMSVLQGAPWREALATSSRLMQGRWRRVVSILAGWQVLKFIAVSAALLALDQLNHWLLARFESSLGLLLWSAVTLLVFDAIVLQLVASLFAIGTAALITREYRLALAANLALSANPGARAPISSPPNSTANTWGWQKRVTLVSLLMLLPVANLVFAALLAHEFVEHRPAFVTAHRGGPSPAPENSLWALRLAMEAKADYVELDVQQTSDGHVILLHDRDLRRVTNDRREMADVTLEQLRELRLLFGTENSEYGVPTLAEFLAGCDDKIRLNVELKETSRHPQLVSATVAELKAHDFLDRAVVSCFDLPPLLESRELAPALPIGLILTTFRGDMTTLEVNFVSLNQRLVRAELVGRLHEHDMQVHVWTVNDRESAVRMLDLGCDNLITSDPVLMREVVDWYAGLGDVERLLLRFRRWARE